MEIYDTKYRDYLRDLSIEIIEMALEAKKNAISEKSDFRLGYLAGFHRVVSLMQQQAVAFGIQLEDIGLEGIDSDTDLI